MNTDPTATEVERCEMEAFCPMEPMNAKMYRCPDGEWVRYEDYEKLKLESQTWEKLFSETFEDSKKLGSECVARAAEVRDLKRQIEALESKLDGRLL